MNKIVTREMRRALERENARQSAVLQIVPMSTWPDVSGMTQKPIAVFRSRDFIVQTFDEGVGITRLSIARTTMRPDGRWDDGITWDELQGIKRQIGFGDCQAVEIFPRDRDLVNVANMRHLWVLREPLDFGWGVER